MAIRYRIAEIKDQSAIVVLNKRSSDAVLLTYSENSDVLDLSSYFRYGGCFWVAEDMDSGDIVGMVGLKKPGAHTGKVKALRVDPQYRRQGIARQLLALLEVYCKENHCTSIILGVNADTTAAIALYESLGFTKFDEKMFPSGTKAYYYKKEL